MASITLHGNDELSNLLDHYGSSQTDTFQGTTISQEPDANADMTRAEWQNFKHLMFLKRQEFRERYDSMITNAKTEEREMLTKEKENFGVHQLWASIKVNNMCEESLLFIAMETQKEGFGDDAFEHFVDELKRQNPR